MDLLPYSGFGFDRSRRRRRGLEIRRAGPALQLKGTDSRLVSAQHSALEARGSAQWLMVKTAEAASPQSLETGKTRTRLGGVGTVALEEEPGGLWGYW